MEKFYDKLNQKVGKLKKGILHFFFLLISLNLFAQAPGNNCATFVNLTLPAVGASITTGAQTTCGRVGDFPAGFSSVNTSYGGGEDGVYRITVPAGGGNYTFSFPASGATWKILSIHTACPPSTANTVGGFTTGGGTSGSTTLNLAAGTYFIIIDTWPTPNCGGFTLNITRNVPPNPCGTAINIPTAPVTNQALTCNATALPGALNATNVPVACGTATNDYKGGQDAIYTFTPTATGNYTISYSGQTWSAIFVYSGACPASGGTCVGSVGSSASTQSITVNLTAGVQYFIWFDTWPTPNSPCPGNFSISVPPCVGASGTPTSLTSSGITTTTATISWTAATTAPTTGYQYFLSTSPTAPTGATVPTGSTAVGVTSVNLTGLIPNTTYYFWVRSNCGGTQSGWAGSGSFSTTGCTGAPTGGTSSASSTSVCSGVNFTLTNTGMTNGAGITYVWQFSSDNLNWTNIGTASATYTSQITNQTSARYYRLLTTCTNSGNSTGSASVLVNMAGSCQCASYCASNATSGADDEIFNVTLGTLNNSSNCATLASGPGSVLNMYSNYTGAVAAPNLQQGTSYPLSVTVGMCSGFSYSGIVTVYIDYNQNGLFTDAGELVYTSPYTAFAVGGTTVSTNITIPAGATLGTTRMRVIEVESTVAQASCGTYNWGETEDYCVNITAPPPCTGTPNAGTASINFASGCASSAVTLSATGLTSGIGITYQWQSAPAAGGPWTNIVGATAATLNQNPTATTFYRLVTTCSNSGLTNTSNAVSFTVNTCSSSITLTDAFGDGWNGATMTLNVNGSPVAVFGSTFTTGTSQTLTFCLPSNSTYDLVYTNGGLYPGEVGVSLTVNGAVVYSIGAGGATVGSTLVTGTACPPPCTGTPTGGTSTAVAGACSGVNFTVSNTGQTPASTGITYQWQSSPNNSTWTNVGAATATYAPLTTSLTASTYYRLLTTCTNSGLSAGSASTLVTLLTGNCQCLPYCATTNNTGACITNVTFNTLNSNSTCSAAPSYYTFGASTTSVQQGATYTFSVSTAADGTYPTAITSVWFDWNQNGVFEATEWYQPYTNAVTGTINVTVPAGATLGTTRMRVRSRGNGNVNGSGDACTTMGSGETEDYCITIIVPTPCSGTPNAGTATISSTSACSGTVVNLTASGLSNGFSGLTYQWQSASNPAGPWTNITGATSTSTTQTPAVGTTYYRLLTTCSNSGLTNNTNTVSFQAIPCISTNVPATGNNSVLCGSSTLIYDSGGSAGDYGNSQGGYTVLQNSGTGVINLTGSWTYMETSFDYLRIYSGVGTGGTLLATYNGSGGGTITPITTAPGQALTIEFTSDGSVVGAGFALQALYSGDCNACTGTPAAGTAAISAASGCASVGVNLTATGLSSGNGISFQWQSSSSPTGPWSNISGATLAAYTATPTATTYYRISTTCANGGASNTSNAVLYTVNLSGLCACGNYPSNFASNNTDEDISNVTVGTMNNSSTCATVATGPGSIQNRYSNYTGSVTGPTAQQTTSVSFSLTQTSCGIQDLNFFQIYIDWNQDGDFLDAGEQVYSQPVAVNGNQTVTGTFTVPLTSTLGTTRMRVVSIGDNASTTNYAHNTYSWGETEDYCFTVTSPPPCAAPTGLTVSALTTTSATVSWSAVTGATSYQYFLTTSATAPTAGTTPTGTTASTSVNLTSLTPYTVYYFWVRNDCGYGQSTWTGTTFQPSDPTCLNTNGYSVIAAGNNNCPIVNSTCDFQDGFVEFTGIVTGRTYNFDFLLNGASNGWITIRSGNFSGPAVWSGAAPILNWTSTVTGSLFVHYNTNSNCDQAIICGFSSIECVSCASGAASNDLICNATNVSCNSTVTGTTICASNNGAGENLNCNGIDQTRGGVWYRITGTGDVITASLCNTTWDSKITVFSGTCAAPVCVGGNDDDGPTCTGLSASYSWTSVTGTDYFILVHGYLDDQAFTLNISCNPPDPTSITASSTYVCSAGSNTVTLTANGAYGTVYWFEGSCATTGQIATGNSITVTPTATTNYYARNFSGGQFSQNCVDVRIEYHVSPSVAPSFDVNPICNGLSSLLTANATAGTGTLTTYSWSSGITGSNVNGFVNTAGTYTVTVTDNLGCTATGSAALTVNALPSAAPDFAANPVCSGSNATLNANATAGSGTVSNYSWSSGITGNNASGNVSSAGTYTVTVTNSNGCTATATSPALTLNTLPSVAVTASSTTVCEGSNVTLTGSGATSYSWSGGITNGQAFPATTATTTYNVTGTDANGCTGTNSVNLVVNTVSTAPTVSSVPGTICPNTNTSVSAGGGIAGTGSSIRWYSAANGGGTLLGTGSSISLPFAASTTVYVRREGTCNNTADVSTTINIRAFMPISANSAVTPNYCQDNDGWNHWYNSNDEIIFSAKGDFSMCGTGYPLVTISRNNANSFYNMSQNPTSLCNQGLTPGEMRFEMGRNWNLDLGGATPNGLYSVRFYFLPTERSSVIAAAADTMTNNAYTNCGYSPKYNAGNSGWFWFKNVGTTYVAPQWEGVLYDGALGTTSNSVTYVEMDSIPGFSGGSGGVILVPNSTLPISWKSFTGETDNKVNYLKWITATEENTELFEVQRSADGINFETIGLVAAAGSSSSDELYNFDDVNPIIGINYYRLRLVELDGTMDYSNDIALEVKGDKKPYVFYPNPVTEVLTYQFSTEQGGDVTIEVMDALGRVLKSENRNSVMGSNQLFIDMSNLIQGTYSIRVRHIQSAEMHTDIIIKK